MINTHQRCNGAFIGHAIASNYDASISMAVEISESLLEKKRFDGPDILSRYLNMYHRQPSEIGTTTKYLYQLALNRTNNGGVKSSISRQDFLFDSSIISEFVETTHNKHGGHTAGCGPAQRSFPLALYFGINDDDLFQISIKEAALTHFHPLAGQVAGIVNCICRSLLRNKPWNEAVRSAFTEPRLDPIMLEVCAHYCRSSDLHSSTNNAYAPAALNAALHYTNKANDAKEAIEKACTKDKYYCAPIVGILSGARWSIPLSMYQHHADYEQFRTIDSVAGKLSNQWPLQSDM